MELRVLNYFLITAREENITIKRPPIAG